jgi:hypothetical protein
MKALYSRCLIASLLCALCTLSAAQDVGVAHIGNANTLDPAVAHELRIQTLIDALGISGEQEPSFRVVMGQVRDLETAYLASHGEKSAKLHNDSEVLAASEKLVAPVLYPTQVVGFRELEQDHLWQMRGQAPAN